VNANVTEEHIAVMSKLASQLGSREAINDVLRWANKFNHLLTPEAREELIELAGKYIDP
jgi:hypothetical protein